MYRDHKHTAGIKKNTVGVIISRQHLIIANLSFKYGRWALERHCRIQEPLVLFNSPLIHMCSNDHKQLQWIWGSGGASRSLLPSEAHSSLPARVSICGWTQTHASWSENRLDIDLSSSSPGPMSFPRSMLTSLWFYISWVNTDGGLWKYLLHPRTNR